MRKLVEPRTQIYPIAIISTVYFALNILYLINYSNYDIDLYGSNASRYELILSNVIFYVLPVIIVFVSIIFFKDKWLGFKALAMSFPFIVVSYVIKANTLVINTSFRDKIDVIGFACGICLAVTIIYLLLIRIASIISFIFKQVKK